MAQARRTVRAIPTEDEATECRRIREEYDSIHEAVMLSVDVEELRDAVLRLIERLTP